MDLARVLAQLHAELENLDAAIASLERIQQGGKRRGRPPEALAGLHVRKAPKQEAKQEPPKTGRPSPS
jgi:hypothetical protein